MKTETFNVHICGQCGEKFFDANECATCEQFDVISSKIGAINPRIAPALESARGDFRAMARIIGVVRSVSDLLWKDGSAFHDYDSAYFEEKVESPAPKPPERSDPLRREIRL